MAKKTLEHYMILPYRVEIYPEEDGSGYTAKIPDLPGCLTSADTVDELWDMIKEAKELWLKVALEDGDYIPEPSPVEIQEYSGKFLVRIPRSLHRQLAYRAKQENTSLNQLVVMLLSEGTGRWTERKSILWPYLRQTLHDLTNRMQLGIPPLPIIDPRALVGSPSGEDTEKADE